VSPLNANQANSANADPNRMIAAAFDKEYASPTKVNKGDFS
jgi:hypothetical protein